MPVIFVGDRTWKQVAEPEWTSPGWEIKRASVLYRGPRTGKTAFENTIFDFETMPGNPAMRLESWQSKNTTPSFPGVEKTFVGFRNGLPPAKGVPSISAQVARVTGTDTASGQKVSASVAYRASRTTWEWWENSFPSSNPRYAYVLFQNDPRNQIDYVQIENADGQTTVPYSSFVAIINALALELVVEDYTTEPIVPNAIWRCSSTIDWRIRST